MRKLLLLSVFIFIIGCSGKNESQKTKEIVQWSELLSPQTPLYNIRKPAYDKYIEENPIPLPLSSDMGPALYRERSQRYLLQGKSGIPDMLDSTLEQVYTYIAANMADPIEDLYDKDLEKDIFYPSLTNALTINGHLYAFPNTANVRLLVYRKDILDKYNLKVPTTWDELIFTAKTIKEKEGINGFMFTTQTKEVRAFQEFMSFYFTLADHIYDVKDGKATYIARKDDLEKVLKLYKGLFDVAIDNNAKGQDWKAIDYGITGGQTAMVTVGPWIWEHLNEEPARGEIISNLAVAPIPLPPNGTPGTYMEIKGIVMNPYSSKDRREDAYKALKTLVSKPLIEVEVDYSGSIPIRNDVKSKNAFGQSFADNINTGKVLEFINWDIPQNYIIDAIQSVIYERDTPKQAADKLDKSLKDYAPKAVIENLND